MKINLIGTHGDGVHLFISYDMLTTLGWRAGDEVTIDIPETGGGLRVTKEGDPLTHYKGVREVVHART